MTTSDQILSSQRFARAADIIADTTAVNSNDFELEIDAAKVTPRYLVVECSAGSPIWAFQAETIEDAAEFTDTSETEGVDSVQLFDLDTAEVYQADRRTVGFNLMDRDDASQPFTGQRRIEINPARFSSFQPAKPSIPSDATIILDASDLQWLATGRAVVHATGLRLQVLGPDNQPISPTPELDGELERGTAAATAFALHVLSMGAAEGRQTVTLGGFKIAVTAEIVK